jgi:hypothetical protein
MGVTNKQRGVTMHAGGTIGDAAQGGIAGVRTAANNDTLVLEDAGKVVEMFSASVRTITIPPNADVAFEVGTLVNFSRMGSGTVQIAEGAGVTINSALGDTFLAVQYSGASAYYRGGNTWILFGDLAAS